MLTPTPQQGQHKEGYRPLPTHGSMVLVRSMRFQHISLRNAVIFIYEGGRFFQILLWVQHFMYQTSIDVSGAKTQQKV